MASKDRFFLNRENGNAPDDKGNSYYGLALNTAQVTELQVAPEPSTMLLFGFGLIGLASFRRKLKRA